jgi:probable rRNA maturation factor
MAVRFFIEKSGFKLKNKNAIKRWIERIIFLEKKKSGDLNFVFMDDEHLLKRNQDFLQHDTYTDIITFDYCERNKINGDVLISVDRVKENAAKFNEDIENELHRVIIHGVLHLCGYSDKTKEMKTRMRKKENWALKKFVSKSE